MLHTVYGFCSASSYYEFIEVELQQLWRLLVFLELVKFIVVYLLYKIEGKTLCFFRVGSILQVQTYQALEKIGFSKERHLSGVRMMLSKSPVIIKSIFLH